MALERVEAALHEWFLENEDKVHPNFWWDVKLEFLSEMLRGTGITHQDYAALRAQMVKRFGLEMIASSD